MPSWSIAATYTFDAAHQLPSHEGKCRRLHGHTYLVEAVVFGYISLHATGPQQGMVMDFDVLNGYMQPLVECLDHQYLNEALPLAYLPPTAEQVARWFYDQLDLNLPGESKRVTVWETPTHRASYGDGILP